MKTLIRTLVILVTINGSIMAKGGFDLQKEIVIDVSAEELWEMVGPGFVEVYKWSSNVDYATGSGDAQFDGASCDERTCAVNVSGFSNIKEKLTNYSVDQKTLTYAVFDGMPGFITKAENTWTVVSMGPNQSKLVMNASFGSKGLMGFMMNGLMKKKMANTLETVLNDAKIYAETGKVSQIKRERIEELEKSKAA